MLQHIFSLCLDVTLTCGLIVIDADPVQLQIAVSVVGPGGIDAVLITDHLPELRKKWPWKIKVIRCSLKHILIRWINIFYRITVQKGHC